MHSSLMLTNYVVSQLDSPFALSDSHLGETAVEILFGESFAREAEELKPRIFPVVPCSRGLCRSYLPSIQQSSHAF